MVIIAIISCRKGCMDELAVNYNEKAKKDDGSCKYQQDVTIKFTHNFNGANLTVEDYDTLIYTNANGELLSINKLQYLISQLTFYKKDGTTEAFDNIIFIDLENSASLIRDIDRPLDPVEYTAVGFTFGLNGMDNISNAYSGLDALDWSWPDVIGGGYHQLKLEGKFVDSNGDITEYLYHNGSATKSQTGVFQPNFFNVKIPNSDFELTNTTVIEIQMDLAEWFKTPNKWDLNAMHNSLRSNHDAQVMMSENGGSVFSLGEIEQ